MKRLLALLLILCLTVSLIACGSTGDPEPSEDPTESTGTEDDDKDDEKEEEDNSYKPNPAFSGKTLQMWGLAGSYKDITTAGTRGEKLDSRFMMLAAIDDWAALNNVTIEYMGAYNINAVLAAIKGDQKPDILFTGLNNFNIAQSLGVLRPFTQAEENSIAQVCDQKYLDMCRIATESYGLNFPWNATEVLFYNETLFKAYEAKTPMEYFKEGNWTWETLQQAMKDVTKDANGDGAIDSYGMDFRSLSRIIPYVTQDIFNGQLTSQADTALSRDFMELLYETYTVDGSLKGNSHTLSANVTPRPAMYVGDCEVYDFAKVYQTLANGDQIRCVPSPIRSSQDPTRYTAIPINSVSICSATDEAEASVDLLKYIMQVGCRYIYDLSVGLSDKYELDGIQGAGTYSSAWKTRFENLVADRTTAFAAIEDFDKSGYNKVIKQLNESPIMPVTTYTGVSTFLTVGNCAKPVSDVIDSVKQSHATQVATYNNTYMN